MAHIPAAVGPGTERMGFTAYPAPNAKPLVTGLRARRHRRHLAVLARAQSVYSAVKAECTWTLSHRRG